MGVFHHRPQNIGSDMRFCVIKDILGSAERMKHLEHVLGRTVTDAADELAVRERPCPTRAELNVRFGIERASRKKALRFFHSVVERVAAFEDDRTVSVFSENQRGEHSRRTESDHDRACAHNLVSFGKIERFFRAKLQRIFAEVLRRLCRNVTHTDNGTHKTGIPPTACVEGSLMKLYIEDVAYARFFQTARSLGEYLLRRCRHGQSYIFRNYALHYPTYLY